MTGAGGQYSNAPTVGRVCQAGEFGQMVQVGGVGIGVEQVGQVAQEGGCQTQGEYKCNLVEGQPPLPNSKLHRAYEENLLQVRGGSGG